MATSGRDLARALVRRHRRARAEKAARAAFLRSELERALREAAREGRIRRAFLIGSLARGDFGAGSDVDVVVEGLSPAEAGPFWAELIERLGAEVDLLRIEELPERFRAKVEAEGVLLHDG